MAEVAQRSQLSERIDDYLAYLLGTWRSIPELAAEWEQWDDDSRLTFAIDWGVPADRLHQLQQWAEQGLLTPSQRDRYEQLRQLVTQHRSAVERLLAD